MKANLLRLAISLVLVTRGLAYVVGEDLWDLVDGVYDIEETEDGGHRVVAHAQAHGHGHDMADNIKVSANKGSLETGVAVDAESITQHDEILNSFQTEDLYQSEEEENLDSFEKDHSASGVILDTVTEPLDIPIRADAKGSDSPDIRRRGAEYPSTESVHVDRLEGRSVAMFSVIEGMIKEGKKNKIKDEKKHHGGESDDNEVGEDEEDEDEEAEEGEDYEVAEGEDYEVEEDEAYDDNEVEEDEDYDEAKNEDDSNDDNVEGGKYEGRGSTEREAGDTLPPKKFWPLKILAGGKGPGDRLRHFKEVRRAQIEDWVDWDDPDRERKLKKYGGKKKSGKEEAVENENNDEVEPLDVTQLWHLPGYKEPKVVKKVNVTAPVSVAAPINKTDTVKEYVEAEDNSQPDRPEGPTAARSKQSLRKRTKYDIARFKKGPNPVETKKHPKGYAGPPLRMAGTEYAERIPFPVEAIDCDHATRRLSLPSYMEAREGLLSYCDKYDVDAQTRHLSISKSGDVIVYVCNVDGSRNFCSRNEYQWLEENILDITCGERQPGYAVGNAGGRGYGRAWKGMRICPGLRASKWTGNPDTVSMDGTNPIQESHIWGQWHNFIDVDESIKDKAHDYKYGKIIMDKEDVEEDLQREKMEEEMKKLATDEASDKTKDWHIGEDKWGDMKKWPHDAKHDSTKDGVDAMLPTKENILEMGKEMRKADKSTGDGGTDGPR